MLRRACLVLLLIGATSGALALEYASLGSNAIVLDANSRLGKPQFILLKGTPVEQLVVLEHWVKIREAGGGIGWVERGVVSPVRQLIVTAASAEVRQAASPDAAVAFTVARDVLLEPVDKVAGPWVKVRHRDGRSGFVEVRSVWGQ